ncbi:hypothetical protein MKW92_022395 [Papaver armeniacum]|nr:hypothetical protein MKW92_022395 [Papaver armeniacum]
MGVVERVMFFMALAVLCVASSTAEVYKVGDDKGWTTLSPIPDYQKWSSTKAFKVGDSIGTTLTSGKDTIPINSKGHYWYICGIPGHCAMGQKVDIRVVTHVTQTPTSSSPSAPTPSSGPSPSASTAPAPSPKKSSAVTISKGLIGKFGFVVLAVVAAVAY